jgi:Xaa-Pro aminopeptidase
MKVIKPGLTEVEVAAKLEFLMKSQGSSMPSFDTIIASGQILLVLIINRLQSLEKR